MIIDDPKGSTVTFVGNFAILGYFRQYQTYLDHYGPFWALFGNFGPFFHNSSGAYKNDPKLKHDLDYQMSTKMIQENHEDNININTQ